MTNITHAKMGSVFIKHHSTSSILEIIVTNEDDSKEKIFIDYYQADDLLKCLKQLKGI